MTDPPKYWFPAKRYGWGWGPPTTWQGWLVLGGYFAALIAVIIAYPASTKPLEFFSAILVITVVLLLVCRAKGEPPRWRWGGD